MIVSVVTRGVSDDCNSQTVEGGEVWLRLARANGVFAFHASRDGERWELVRFFALPVRDVPSASWRSLRRGRLRGELPRSGVRKPKTRRSARRHLSMRTA
jgi:hypothetical protein